MCKSLLDVYRRYLKKTVEIISSQDGPRWPRATEPKQREKADRAAVHLESSHERLLERSERLVDKYSDNITLFTNTETQCQAKIVNEQTSSLKRLSALVYFYIPLSFAGISNNWEFSWILGTNLQWAYRYLSPQLLHGT